MSHNTTYTARHRTGFVLASVASCLMMATASAPSPFYPVLKQQMMFSDVMLTAIFAIYAIALLVTLLTGGSSSDHLGRRPILSFGFTLLAVSIFMFHHAPNAEELLLARAVQGIACGFLLSTLSATITDLEPPDRRGLAAVCNATIPLLGLALGALMAGLIMQFLHDPKADMFTALTISCLLFGGLVWLLPETAPMHEGFLQALRPRIGIPITAKSSFWQSAPAIIAGWATGGLYLSLGAPIIRSVFDMGSPLMQAGVITLLAGTGAAACFAARSFTPRQVMIYGTTALAVGTILTLISIEIHSLGLYLITLAFSGTGFGTCFYASLRTIVPKTPPDERGEMFASLFTLSYLAFGIPVVIAGLVIAHAGLHATVLGYGIAIAILAATAGVLRKFGANG